MDAFSLLQVDVTDLLLDDNDEQEIHQTPDEAEGFKHVSVDEKYRSLSSSRSSLSTNETSDRPSPSSFNPINMTDEASTTDENLADTAKDIEEELNHLTAILQEASQISDRQLSTERDHDPETLPNVQRQDLGEVDDQTSKQATQNYDPHDNGHEVSFHRLLPFSFLDSRSNCQEKYLPSSKLQIISFCISSVNSRAGVTGYFTHLMQTEPQGYSEFCSLRTLLVSVLYSTGLSRPIPSSE